MCQTATASTLSYKRNNTHYTRDNTNYMYIRCAVKQSNKILGMIKRNFTDR